MFTALVALLMIAVACRLLVTERHQTDLHPLGRHDPASYVRVIERPFDWETDL